MRLDGKVAIVTGGGSGFGEGIAKRFAEEGCKIIVNDINDRVGKGLRKTSRRPVARRLMSMATCPKMLTGPPC